MDGDGDRKPGDEAEEEEENLESDCREEEEEEAVIDISRKNWEISLFQSSPPLLPTSDGLYVYRNTFNLVPSSVSHLRSLKTIKFFTNDIQILPPETQELINLESLQIKFSQPTVSGVSFDKFRQLKELELCKVPPRPSGFSILGDIGSLKLLTKLSVCYFSIRYLPPQIGCLKKLEELDLSFNKLKSLPNEIAELDALKSLRVANNKLIDLPSGISTLSSLENLDLSNNRLTSLVSLKLASMHNLQNLNLQYNKLIHSCQIPPWIYCDLQGNEEGIVEDEIGESMVKVNVSDVAVHRAHGNLLYNGTSFGCRCIASRGMKKGWKRRDNMQQWARQERLNYSRKHKVEYHSYTTTVKMTEEDDSYNLVALGKRQSELQADVNEERLTDCSAIDDDISGTIEDEGADIGNDSILISHNCSDNEKAVLNNMSCGDDISCLTESSSSNKDNDYVHEKVSTDSSASSCNDLHVPVGNYSSEAAKFVFKPKRHYDKDLDNPKPSKFRRPVDECSSLSCKYSTESFCSINDHLPDGFYDAGRDRPFMSLQDYEQSLCLDSREVILLDRDKDEELDAIATSAQILLSSFKMSCSREDEDKCNNLQRASVLALFVSDCFGGSDRSSSVMRIRKAVVGSHVQQPFICTCSAKNTYDNIETSKLAYGIVSNLNFNDLCERSLRMIKETRNSNVVPIGTLRFGVCRHRSVLMKYLCDRAKPPIPCELVRGYLDFMPHAWNAILVRRGNSCVRMVVDACYPTDIREETDLEYSCRYIPLSQFHVPLTTEIAPFGCSFPSPSVSHGIEENNLRSVYHCKFGDLDVAVKVRNLEACKASQEDIRNFEYTFLGEVRMLGALRKHSCIVEIYGHHLSSKWTPPADGTKENRLFQSIIVMEYVKGGNLKNYLNKLAEQGEKHAPVDIVLCVAKDVACALVELHSKDIIHRDIKSENILIDLDSKRKDGSPIVKLSDFDRSVPLQSSIHTCCIAHLGIHQPDVCVGTPRWMAPEVVQAMYQRKSYGLEVDIWSYGCLLLELLTLRIPYKGQSEAQICHMLQMRQRPRLAPELEALAFSDQTESASEADILSYADTETLKFLVDLFYKCTSGNPADRPTASQIFNDICSISQPHVSPTCIGR